jgi:hypothetical protein
MHDDVSHAWMMRFIARFYRSCCIVQDHDGEIPLHIAVRENVDPHYIRMMILMSPPGITLLFGHKTKCNPAGLSMDISNPKDKLVCHAATDLLHIDDKVVAQNKKYAKIVRARNKCRSIARIFIRRRLVAKNRDVSWLVALEIWASRTDDIWEE